uniref:Uncharacterized protein n=1 Tax=Arundo donax TaxID=35708 RepID=A0A0A9DJW4_ARUDO
MSHPSRPVPCTSSASSGRPHSSLSSVPCASVISRNKTKEVIMSTPSTPPIQDPVLPSLVSCVPDYFLMILVRF